MSFAPVPAAIAILGVVALVAMIRAWGWTGSDTPWYGTGTPMPPQRQRRWTRQAYQLIAMSVFCVVGATASGEYVGYVIGALGIGLAIEILYWVRSRS